MEEKKSDSDFAFEKKLGIPPIFHRDLPGFLKNIHRLLFCMEETNKNFNGCYEFFRLDFRPQYLDETFLFPLGSLILDLKFGSKKEMEEKNKICTNAKIMDVISI
jgi:hypothetical protein